MYMCEILCVLSSTGTVLMLYCNLLWTHSSDVRTSSLQSMDTSRSFRDYCSVVINYVLHLHWQSVTCDDRVSTGNHSGNPRGLRNLTLLMCLNNLPRGAQDPLGLMTTMSSLCFLLLGSCFLLPFKLLNDNRQHYCTLFNFIKTTSTLTIVDLVLAWLLSWTFINVYLIIDDNTHVVSLKKENNKLLIFY